MCDELRGFPVAAGCTQLTRSTVHVLHSALSMHPQGHCSLLLQTSKYRHGTFFCKLLSLPSFQSFLTHQALMSCCVFLKSQERVNLDSLKDRLRMRTLTVLQGKAEKKAFPAHIKLDFLVKHKFSAVIVV